jgi:hypothetical protein
MPRYRVSTIFEADSDDQARRMIMAQRFEQMYYKQVENLSRRRVLRVWAYLGIVLVVVGAVWSFWRSV